MCTACTSHDTCVNNEIMRDLGKLEMACNDSVQDSPAEHIHSNFYHYTLIG